jgi:hypothetical protein
MATTYLRVRPPACVLRHPDHGELVVPNPAIAYASDDPLVVAYPWQFARDDEMAAELAEIVESVEVPRVKQPRPRARKA